MRIKKLRYATVIYESVDGRTDCIITVNYEKQEVHFSDPLVGFDVLRIVKALEGFADDKTAD